ncbi:hypothetical protein [Amycolatopsis lexingtonensis]|uniref:hypothetical protein n=1 Tax=Amycolatopsis lexingtonensis TaxID=218822 RepID=UPI003F6FDBFA
MTVPNPHPDETIAAAAELVLAKLGMPLDQLAAKSRAPKMPTFSEYVPEVAKATAKGSRNTWQYYWRVLVAEWGAGRSTNPAPLKSASWPRWYKSALQRSRTPGPARVRRRTSSTRSSASTGALKPNELREINFIASTTGYDTVLDSLLLRLHSETASRRGGALARRRDLNSMDCTVLLREKATRAGTSRAKTPTHRSCGAVTVNP